MPWDPPSPASLPVIRRYGLAVLSVAIALSFTLLLRRGFDVRGVLFLSAIAITAWYAGMAPGFLAIALSIASLDYFFQPPPYRPQLWLVHLPYLSFFTVLALVIGWFSISRRRAEQLLQHARNELEMKVAERTADLRRTTAELETILDASPVGIALFNGDQTIQRCNPAFEQILGWKAYEIVGRLIPASEINQRQWNALAERLDGGATFANAETRLIRKDGSEFSAAIACARLDSRARLKNERGIPAGFVGTMEDISKRRQAEEALRQAQADLAHVSRVTTLGELTASVAHEVNQPIAAAVTNANTCLRWLAGDTPNVVEARAAAMRIVKDGTRAGEIISRIRLLFQKGTPQRELVDVNEVIREIVVLLRSEATRYSIAVRTELTADLPQVMGDRVQLQQVMMNLIMNSIDAMKDVDGPRELAIRSQPAENSRLLISVSDTGVGLSPQQESQIFNAFFTTKHHGTGMGLSISRSIVQSHGGGLWAADNPPRGASFCFTLPLKVEADE